MHLNLRMFRYLYWKTRLKYWVRSITLMQRKSLCIKARCIKCIKNVNECYLVLHRAQLFRNEKEQRKSFFCISSSWVLSLSLQAQCDPCSAISTTRPRLQARASCGNGRAIVAPGRRMTWSCASASRTPTRSNTPGWTWALWASAMWWTSTGCPKPTGRARGSGASADGWTWRTLSSPDPSPNPSPGRWAPAQERLAPVSSACWSTAQGPHPTLSWRCSRWGSSTGPGAEPPPSSGRATPSLAPPSGRLRRPLPGDTITIFRWEAEEEEAGRWRWMVWNSGALLRSWRCRPIMRLLLTDRTIWTGRECSGSRWRPAEDPSLLGKRWF